MIKRVWSSFLCSVYGAMAGGFAILFGMLLVVFTPLTFTYLFFSNDEDLMQTLLYRDKCMETFDEEDI